MFQESDFPTQKPLSMVPKVIALSLSLSLPVVPRIWLSYLKALVDGAQVKVPLSRFKKHVWSLSLFFILTINTFSLLNFFNKKEIKLKIKIRNSNQMITKLLKIKWKWNQLIHLGQICYVGMEISFPFSSISVFQ